MLSVTMIRCLRVVTLVVLLTGPIVLPQPSSAGSGPGVLTCRSATRRGGAVTLSGEIPGDYEVFNLKIRNGGNEETLRSIGTIEPDTQPDERARLEEKGVIADDRVIVVVEDFKRGVFSIALRRSAGYDLRLYAVPGTIRTHFTTNSKKASFDAMLLQGGSDVYPNWNKAIKMRCTFDHSI